MTRAMGVFSIAQWVRSLIGVLLLMALGACGGGSAAPAAPVIIQQPASQTVEAGKSVTFSVALQDATGASFQWLRNGAEISGAGQASHTLASASMADSGTSWSVRVGNAGGTVTSAVAMLTVTPRPVVTPLGASLFTGSIDGAGNLDGIGSAARLADPGRFAIGAGDVIYVSDRSARILRKISATGEVSRFAGTGLQGTQDGAATVAQFSSPGQIVFDAPRNLLYVVESGAIRRVTLDGQVSTVPGGFVPMFGSIAVGPDGTLYSTTGNLPGTFGDRFPHAIQKSSSQGGTPTLVAGSRTERGVVDGSAAVARFNFISALAVDASGNVYASEGSTVRKVAPDGSVTTLAGSANGFVDGNGSEARFNGVGELTVEPGGSVLAYDRGNRALRRITPQGAVSTVARDLPIVSGLGVDSAGRIVFSTPHAIERLAADGSAQRVAGTREPAPEAAFAPGKGLVVDSKGNVYTTVGGSATFPAAIRKYAASGERVNFAPTGDVVLAGRTGAGSFGSTLAIDGADNLYESDFSVEGPRVPRIVKVTPDGALSVLNTRDSSGRAIFPSLMAANAAGTLFVADEGTGALHRITPSGEVTQMSDLRASFPQPYPWSYMTIAADNAGVVYLAHHIEGTIHRIDPAGTVRLLAGRKDARGKTDGMGSDATFTRPYSIVVDSTGNLFVRDAELVRKIAPDGSVTTVGGIAGQTGTQLGALPRALSDPYPSSEQIGERLAVGRDDVLYVESDKALLKLRLK